jgi:hypothetical protein
VLVSYKGTRAKRNQAPHIAISAIATMVVHHVRVGSASSARSERENGLDMRAFYNLEHRSNGKGNLARDVRVRFQGRGDRAARFEIEQRVR